MMVSKRNLLFQGAIFRFHVKLWEGRFLEVSVAVLLRIDRVKTCYHPNHMGMVG